MADPPPTTKLAILRAAGIAVAVAVTLATALLATKYPALTALNTIVGWVIGKLLGVPLDDVLQAAVRAMAPERAVALTVNAVRSMHPERAELVTTTVLQEIAAHAVGAMPNEQAEYLTRALLESIPPEAKAAVLGKIVFVSSQPPPSAAAEAQAALDPEHSRR